MENAKKKYLTILGSSLVVLVLAVIGLFIYEYFRIAPQDVRFTNITSSSVTVSWNTKKPTSASVIAFEGETSLPVRGFCFGKEKYFDTRDVKEAELIAASTVDESIEDGDFSVSIEDFNTEVEVKDMGNYYTHHVSVTDLNPEMEYSFMVGDQLVFRRVEDVNNQTTVRTYEVPGSVEQPVPAYSTVKNAENTNNPVDELEPVADGVVYFNFFDENTGIRSNILSSTLNKEGNWYIDISMAVGPDGEPYMDTYDTVEGNIIAELIIDAGPLGQWAKKQSAYMLRPGTTSVINTPGDVYDYDVMDSIVPIEQIKEDEEVKGAIYVQSIGEEICEMNGLGTWTGGGCNCVAYASFNSSTGVCSCISGYTQSGTSCVKIENDDPEPCSCGCPTGYSTTITSDNYETAQGSCNNDDCTKPTCYKPLEDDCTGCSCNASCPPNGSSGYTLTHCTDSSVDCNNFVYSTCTRKDSCGNTCSYNGSNTYSRKCYKPNSVTPDPDPDPEIVDCLFNEYCPTDLVETDGYSCYAKYSDGSQGSRGSCKCPTDVLEERNCNYTGEPPEDLQCAGGTPLGDAVPYQGKCRKCIAVESSGGYWIPKYVDASDEYTLVNGVCVTIEDDPPVDDPVPVCGSDYNQSVDSDVSGLIKSRMCDKGIPVGYISLIFGASNYLEWQCKEGEELVKCSATRKESGSNPPPPEVTCGPDNSRAFTNTEFWDWKNSLSGNNYQGLCTPTSSIDIGTIRVLGVNPTLSWACEGAEQSCGTRVKSEPDPKCVCGSATGNHKSGSDWPSSATFCTTGSPSPSSPQFPELSKMVSWSCSGTNCETKNCYAARSVDTPKCGDANGRNCGSVSPPCWPMTNSELCENGTPIPQYQGVYQYNTSWECVIGDPPVLSVACSINLAGVSPNPTPNPTPTPIPSLPAVEEREIDSGEKCPPDIKCICGGYEWVEDIISETISPDDNDRWCREVAGAMNCMSEGQVCNNSGNTCERRQNAAGFNCNGDPVAKRIERDIEPLYSVKKFFTKILTSEVVAQDNSTTSGYILDQETGLFANIEEGVYTFEYEGTAYSFEVTSDLSGGVVFVYIDSNGNGEYDEGTDIPISEIASLISVTNTRKDYTYPLKQGLNFVSMPYLISENSQRTASSLLQELNQIYDDALYSISKFDGGKWVMVGQNTQVYDNNNFQLLPGEGYIIKAKNDINIGISGQPVKFETEGDSAPINLNTGWNLIGLYGTNVKRYTAKSLIEDINTQDFTAINVTKWTTSSQMYEGFQMSSGKEYGFDYPINNLESYFVRIMEGSGNWQPSLGGNN